MNDEFYQKIFVSLFYDTVQLYKPYLYVTLTIDFWIQTYIMSLSLLLDCKLSNGDLYKVKTDISDASIFRTPSIIDDQLVVTEN